MNKDTKDFMKWVNKSFPKEEKYHTYFEFFYSSELLYSDICDYIFQYEKEKNVIIELFDESGIIVKKNENTKTIFFDMDGTFYDLYGFNDWLDCILSEKTNCYTQGNLLVDYDRFIIVLSELRKKGYKLGIITWLSKNATKKYQNKVRKAKYRYINKHFPNLFDEIHIIQYGKNKSVYCEGNNCILFDDEEGNRIAWQNKNGIAYNVINLIESLQSL